MNCASVLIACCITALCVLIPVLWVWIRAHRHAAQRLQLQSKMNAESQAEYEQLLCERNEMHKRLIEAEAWIEQLSLEVKTKYGHKESKH